MVPSHSVCPLKRESANVHPSSCEVVNKRIKIRVTLEEVGLRDQNEHKIPTRQTRTEGGGGVKLYSRIHYILLRSTVGLTPT